MFNTTQTGENSGIAAPEKDYRLEWKDWKNLDCACRIRIYNGIGSAVGKKVVVATDINVGQSVTNECENISTLVCRENKINILEILFIEHYEERTWITGYNPNKQFYAEDFSKVDFKWDSSKNKFHSPNWSSLSHKDVFDMTGTDSLFTRPRELWRNV